MRKTATITAILGFALAGCGGSGNAKEHQAAVNYCVYGDASGGGIGDRPSCECAVTNLEKEGYSDQKILSESKDNTAMLSDKKLIAISVFCAGR